ncbi:carboxylesterase family protein [Amycolatopsis sp. CA-161197]|uniref:carboxylesterase family protein n=1 Tax=Amycolatopsis sp. CA-161197 TaxID=3239922 RepID=UPI003D8CD46B
MPDGDGPPTGKPGNRCPQAADSPGGQPSVTEDCLYLNVTTPAKSGPSRPVMVWLHGGDGAGAGADYDPTRLVDQGNVTVFGESSGRSRPARCCPRRRLRGWSSARSWKAARARRTSRRTRWPRGLGRHTLFTPL